MDPAGKTALLTGATGGLGRAIAERLAAAETTLILSARDPAALERMAEELPGSGHRTLAADLSRESAAARLAEEAGPVDILIANAGIPGTGLLESNDAEGIARMLRLNLEVPAVLCAAVLEGMREREAGRIVLISSLAAKAIPTSSALYAASKAGLRALGRGLRDDYAGTGIGATVVLPGFVREAGMFHESGAKPPPGLGTASPDQVADAALRAIESCPAEIDVAPFPQRALAGFAFHFHSISARLERAAGARRVADQIAAGRARD
jgi:short-subunit dehydrogenase